MPRTQTISFVNVSEGKKSSQSSRSKWSRADEATAVTNPQGEYDFAFHTDRTGAPYWMLDLEARYPLEKIVISNRRDKFQHRMGTLVVEVSDTMRDWTTIHSGLIYTKGDMTFPLSGTISARYVRLRLTEATYLHLARVKVIARLYETYGDKVFLARRNDGLGERLNAMLNAFWLSEIFECGVRFTWPKRFQDDATHAIAPVEEMFAPEFLKAYYVPEEDIAGVWEITHPVRSHTDIAWQLADTGMVTAPRVHLTEIMQPMPELADRGGLQRAFAKINFSASIQQAIDLAKSVDIKPDATALHLRSGDIFFGEFRKLLHYTYKGVTLPIAKNLILHQQNLGRTVYLFGQDHDSLKYLSSETAAIDTTEINKNELANMTRPQRAMYDLILLSRFKTIVGGSSGFSRQAAWIGGGDVLRPTDIFGITEQYEMSLADLADNAETYHPLQAAFAYWYAYFYGRSKRTPTENIPLVATARKLDPDNELYFIVEAALHKLNGGHAQADMVLSELFMSRYSQGNLPDAFRIFSGKTGNADNLSEYFPQFEEMSQDGSFFAAALLSYMYAKKNNSSAASTHLGQCKAHNDIGKDLKTSVLRILES